MIKLDQIIQITFRFAMLFLVTALLFANSAIANAQTTNSFSFGAAGDYANGTNFKATVNAVKSSGVDFQIALGDFAYTVAEQSWCTTWKSSFNNILLVSGNHDDGTAGGGDINTYNSYCPYTLSSPMTGTYGKQYYFDYPAVNPIARFILIVPGIGGTSIGFSTNYSLGSQGYTFTQNAIDSARASGIKWVIVGFHKNYITMLEKPNEIGTDLMKMLIDKRVDVIMQGHEHGYERSKQLTCAKVNTYDPACVVDSDSNLVKGAGSIIHVLGTGGQGLRAVNLSDSEAPYFAAYDNTTYGFGKFTVSPTQLSYNFIRSAGGTFTDSFTITDTTGGGILLPTATPIPFPTATPRPLPTATPIPFPTATPIPTSVPGTITTPTPTPTVTTCQNTLPVNSGLVQANIDVTEGTSYKIWSRIMSKSDDSNSFWLQIDDACPINVGDLNGSPASTWQWVDYKEGAEANKIIVPLSIGTHTLKLVGREIGLRLDKLIFASDIMCIPSENGDNCMVAPTPTIVITSTPTLAPTNIPTIAPTSIITPTSIPGTIITPTPTIRLTSTPTPTPIPPVILPSPTPTPEGGLTTLIYNPTDDATVRKNSSNRNYGKATTLEVDQSSLKNILMKFNVTGIGSRTIVGARIRLYAVDGSPFGGTFHKITNNSWNENTVTWNNAPQNDISSFTSLGKVTSGQYYEIDAMELVKGDGVIGVKVHSSNADGADYASREQTNPVRRPQLIIIVK